MEIYQVVYENADNEVSAWHSKERAEQEARAFNDHFDCRGNYFVISIQVDEESKSFRNWRKANV